MTERVSKLRVIDNGTSPSATGEALLDQIHAFVSENIVDLSGEIENDVLLEQPRSDEKRLGVLTTFERRAFVIGALLEQHINDLLVEFEATATEQVSQMMRERRISFTQATQAYMTERRLPESQRVELNTASITHSNVVTLFDWSVRRRFNQWTSFLIVRHDFTVYSFN